jgi:hypothetical protein
VAHVHVRISPAGAGPVRSGPGSYQETVAAGGQGRSLHSTWASRLLQVVHDLRRLDRATIIVPRGAHQIVQRPVEVLSPRGISMSLSEVLATYCLDQLLAIEWRPRYLRPLRPAWTQCGMDGRRGPIVQPVKNDDYRCR